MNSAQPARVDSGAAPRASASPSSSACRNDAFIRPHKEDAALSPSTIRGDGHFTIEGVTRRAGRHEITRPCIDRGTRRSRSHDHASILLAWPRRLPARCDHDRRPRPARTHRGRGRPLLPKLTDILAYVDTLQQVDTTGVPPTSHPVSEQPVWRADEPRPSLDRATVVAQGAGASVAAGLFKVPTRAGGPPRSASLRAWYRSPP